ncbi:MAG: endoribonuclease YicC domain-containing protein [Dictyoglomus turgidum]
MKSMTASAFRELSIDSLNFFLEVKGYNHRFLEIKINLPDTLSSIEKEIAREIKKFVKRGFILFSIKIIKDHLTNYKINVPLIMNILEEIGRITGKEENIWDWKEILANPQIFYVENRFFRDEDFSNLLTETKILLEEFNRIREEEGKSIFEALERSLDKIESLLFLIKKEEGKWQKEAKEFLERKLKEFNFKDIDENRLYQELSLLLMKTDINEEIIRIEEFVRRFKNEMKKEESIGKTLEFIVQEIHREVNTLSSKTAKTSVMFYAVDIKNELEKIRELILNVE